jgi:hypothetical protein
MKIIISLILLICLSSCIDFSKNQHLEAVNALNHEVDSIHSLFEKNSMDSIVYMRVEINNIEQRIKRFYTGDTIDRNLGRKMDTFRKIKKSIMPENEVGEEAEHEGHGEPIMELYKLLQVGLKDEKKTLNLLYSDINSGSGDRKKYENFIAFEREKVDQLKVIYATYLTQKIWLSKNFNQIRNDLMNYTLQLEQASLVHE